MTLRVHLKVNCSKCGTTSMIASTDSCFFRSTEEPRTLSDDRDVIIDRTPLTYSR
jgi:hypothetical protein